MLPDSKRVLMQVLLASLLANLLLLTPTVYMLQIYDRVMISRNELTLLAISVIALFFYVVLTFTERLQSRILLRAATQFDERLHSSVFKANFDAALNRGLHKPAEAFSDLNNIRQFITSHGFSALFDVPWMPIYIAVSWMLHPVLGLLSVAFTILFLTVGWIGHRLTNAHHPLSQKAVIQANNFVQGKLRNAETVYAMGMHDGLKHRWLKLHQREMAVSGRIQDHGQRFQSVAKFVQYSQQAVVLATGAFLVIKGELTPGAMIAANVLMARALQPAQVIAMSWKSLMAAKLAYQRLSALLAQHAPHPNQVRPESLRAEITLQDLTAIADGRKQPILDRLNATFRPGEVVVIVGPSGSGKSTLLRCVLGIWPQTRGQVQLDRRAIEDWDRDQIGRHIGYLPQDLELFEGSVAENIARFGQTDAAKVIAAAQSAGVHDMILRLPQGYDTQIGASGATLSGGQRQRIALARALYDSPALIALDEPDSNLDHVGETNLAKAVHRLKVEGKTVLIVSHRDALLKLADRIMVLKSGRIESFDTHDKVFPSGATASSHSNPELLRQASP